MARGVRSPCGSRMPYSPRNACRSDVRAIPWMLWTIWKNRNSLLYAEVQEFTSMLVHRALEESTLWNELNKVEQRDNQISNDLGVPGKYHQLRV
ncbi:BnaC03g46890D [Brassica napus]|uniref:BnaC03g46890D protein n=1 Tax=Brassica napus TaxID=3708 RepID=A0A078H141_BRANA|nr:BnaC03g46890D [Brassica napus]